jgi:4-diphosphocytidyl-2-C-methyl-D-erythritol kinase
MQDIGYAKLNLALHVRAREPDGYHRLETLFAFARDGDLLSVAQARELTLDVAGPFGAAIGPAGDNLVMRAAKALQARFGVTDGAALTLDKRLPVASGIGGGSADAAAALRLLVRWWRLPATPDDLHAIAATLGADVPACVRSVTASGEGRGDRLHPVSSDLAGTPVLLVNPGLPVPTGPVFRGWDGIDRGPLARDASLSTLRAARNDLEGPAVAIAPAIRPVLDDLARQPGAALVRMSGSGATCFALFRSDAERDAAAARLRSTGWWQLATCLR